MSIIWMRELKEPKIVVPQPATVTYGYKGEYRAILRNGLTGRLKYDSGWVPNMILDQGFTEMVSTYSAWFTYMNGGDSATAVAAGQTGIQGTFLAGAGPTGLGFALISSSPYQHRGTSSYNFPIGVGTGTWREFVIASGANASAAANEAAVRQLFSPAIVKGASDDLTVEWRLSVYPQSTDSTGVVDIGGTNYNYTMRHWNVDTPGNFVSTAQAGEAVDRFINVVGTGSGGGENTLVAVNADLGTYTGGPYVFSSVAYSTSGTGPGAELHTEATADIDTMNADVDYMHFYQATGPGWPTDKVAGIQLSIGKVSDGSPLTKENTHEFKVKFKRAVARYP